MKRWWLVKTKAMREGEKKKTSHLYFCLRKKLQFQFSLHHIKLLHSKTLTLSVIIALRKLLTTNTTLTMVWQSYLVHSSISKEKGWVIQGNGGGRVHIVMLIAMEEVNELLTDLSSSQWSVHAGWVVQRGLGNQKTQSNNLLSSSFCLKNTPLPMAHVEPCI